MATAESTENLFEESYKILKDIAETLRNQSEPNIDQLIPQIEKATKAYKLCKERLENVSESLSKMLPTKE